MLTAVDLDDQLSLLAEEIGDERTHGNLTPKAVSTDLFFPQPHPETHFGIGHLSTELSTSLNLETRGEGHGDRRLPDHEAPTLPSRACGAPPCAFYAGLILRIRLFPESAM